MKYHDIGNDNNAAIKLQKNKYLFASARSANDSAILCAIDFHNSMYNVAINCIQTKFMFNSSELFMPNDTKIVPL